MNKQSPMLRRALRWLAMAALTGMVLVMFMLPPPASSLALFGCVVVSAGLVLKRLGYSGADYAALARGAAKRIIEPVRALVGLVMWVNRGQRGEIREGALARTEDRLLFRVGVAVEIAIIVWMVWYATTRFHTADGSLQLSGGETEWITNSAYAAANGLRDYGRIPLWQPLLEFGEPLIDNPVSFVLNPFSSGPSLILGAAQGLKISVVLTVLVAGIGGWVLGWTLGLGAVARVLLGLLLVGKGNMHAMFLTGYFQLAASQAYFPWIIAGAVGIFRLPKARWPVAALALGAALLLFAGNVWYTLPMAICVVVVGVVYFFLPPHPPTPSPPNSRERGGISAGNLRWLRTGEGEQESSGRKVLPGVDWGGLRRLVLAGVLAVGISAMSLLPMLVNQGQLNKHPPETEAGWIVPLWKYAIPFYFNPDPFQHVEYFTPHDQRWVTEMNIDRVAEFFYSFVTPYWFLGLIFVALPFYRPRWNRLWWVAWGLLIFFTLWGAGRLTGIYEHLAFFQGWRFVGRAFGVGAFWIAVLLAMRVDSLWRIITTTRWEEAAFRFNLRWMPLVLGAVLIAGGWRAAYQVNEQWDLSPNTSVLRIDDDDLCVSWLRAHYPDRELTIWRWGYEGVTTLMNNRVRIYDVMADFEMSPAPSTIGTVDLTRTLPEFALLNSNIEREFMAVQGYRVILGSPNFPRTISPCMYRKLDALSYIYTVPLEVVLNAPEPSADVYAQPFTTLPTEETTPITTFVRQPDTIVMAVQGDVMQNRVLTVQERAYPGWRVSIDGRPAKLESVGGQIGVMLPRDMGQHIIIFEYRPTLLVVGGWITLAAAAFSILYLLRGERPLWRWAGHIANLRHSIPLPTTLAGYGEKVYPAVGWTVTRVRRLRFSRARWGWSDDSRGVRVQVLTLGGVGLMILSALFFRVETPDEWLGAAWGLMAGGGLALGGALLVGRRVEGAIVPSAIPALRQTTGRINWILTGVGVGLLAALVIINVTGHPISRFTQVSHHVQFALFVGGVSLFGLGVGGFRKPHPPLPIRGHLSPFGSPSPADGEGELIPGQMRPAWRREALILLAVLVFAAVPRLIQLGQTTRFEVDELQSVMAVNALEATPTIPILNTIKPLHWNWAWLFPYVQMWLVEGFGHTWFGLRLIGALCGVAGVAALYALARAWFDRGTATAAALLLAALPAYIHFSRLSLINITDPVFGVAALAGLSWGMRTNRRACYVFGGVMLGLTQYFYEGGRLLFPAVTAVWLVGMALLWRGKIAWRKVGVMLVTAVVVAAPFYLMMAAVGRPFGERVNDHYGTWELLLGPMDALLNNLIQPFLLVVHYSDSSIGYIYYGGEQPLLLPYVVVVFLLGIVYAVWRGWQPGMMLVGLWLGMGVVGTALTVNDGVNVRFTSFYTTFPLLAAVGIRQTAALLWPKERRWQGVVLGVVTALLCIGQIHHYFAVYLPVYEVEFRAERPGRDLDDAVERAAALPAGTHIHIVTHWDKVDQYYIDQITWMSAFMLDDQNVRLLAKGDFTAAYVERLAREANQAFFVAPDNQEAIALIEAAFPNMGAGQPSPFEDIPAWEEFILYYAEGTDRR